MATTYCEPTVLWRLWRARDGEATEVVVPHWRYATVVLFENGAVMSCEDYRSLGDAVTAANHARRRLESVGWFEQPDR